VLLAALPKLKAAHLLPTSPAQRRAVVRAVATALPSSRRRAATALMGHVWVKHLPRRGSYDAASFGHNPAHALPEERRQLMHRHERFANRARRLEDVVAGDRRYRGSCEMMGG